MKEKLYEFENFIIPSSYFEPEAREGFYVSGMMKRYWAVQLKVLSEIAKICERHAIRWFADCGTLMGAVRHGGYIPWDDDLDICMLREDWYAFEEKAQSELPEGYFVRTIRTDPEHDDILMRVINSQGIDFSEEYLAEYYGCPYSVGVDIFPLDGVYENEAQEEDRRARIKTIETVIECLAEGKMDTPECSGMLYEIERQNKVTLSRGEDIVTELLLLSEKIYTECPTGEASHVALMNYWLPCHNHKYPKELFKDIIYLPFEGILMPVPARYDEVLKIEYGDYMYIYKGGGVHEYPCYGRQEAIFRARTGENLYRYTFDKDSFRRIREEQRFLLWEHCREMLDMLSKAHKSLDALVEKGQAELAGKLLEQCQALAISIGTELEKKTGENAEIIRLLEWYCEELYQSAADWRGSCSLEEIAQQVRGEFDKIKETVKEIVFLPCHIDSWRTMAGMWQEVDGKAEVMCYVIPIPYYERDADGSLGAICDEQVLLPADIPITDLNDYDFEKHHPDMIVVDQPYDGWNQAGSVSEFFFSENLRRYTDKLVYLSCLDLEAPTDEEDKASKAIAELVEQPALIYADEVILQSEKMREFYINHLTTLAGEDSRAYWERKIMSATADVHRTEKPGKKDMQKPVLLFHTTISFILEYRERAIESIRRALATIMDTEKITCIWCVDETVSALQKFDPKLWQLFQDVYREYEKTEIKICNKNDKIEEALVVGDAFYGNPGRLAHKCRNRKMPVMIQSADH